MFEELQRRMNRFWNSDRTLEETDPEFIALFTQFAFEEVVHEPAANDPQLTESDRILAILAAIIGAQGMDAFDMMLPVAYTNGVTSIQLKELIYQATAYVGFAHTLPYLKRVNTYLNAENVALPLPSQADTDTRERSERGEEEQVRIFGETMRGFAQSGPESTQHIRRWLSANCFGDYYTRGGLTVEQREMITLCLLVAQGGCEDQVRAHIRGNLHIGHSVHYLIAVLSQCLPYIGYPRTLNGLACVQQVATEHTDTDQS